MSTITEQIAEYAANLKYEDLTEDAIARAKVRLLDSLGVICAGQNGPGNDAYLDIARHNGGAQDASVFVYGDKLPMESAAVMNALMMRSYDFEAIEAEGLDLKSFAAHISGTTVPTALAVAEATHATGKEMLTALILGDDVAARLGANSGFDVYAGWDNTGTQNCLAATLIAGKMMGLDKEQFINALGIAENMLGSVVDNINDHTLAFKLPIALSCRNAILAAQLASKGFTAMRDAIGGNHGFFNRYGSDAKNEEGVVKDLGKRFFADVVIKPYAACRATHPSITACEEIRKMEGFDVDKIAHVKVRVTPRTLKGFVGQPFELGEGPIPQASGAFSIIFTAADMLYRGQVRPEDYSREKMTEPGLTRIIDAIELAPELDPNEYQTSEVIVTLDDGKEFFYRTEVPKGDIFKNPCTDEEILDKYYKNMEFSGHVTRETADAARAQVEKFEEIDDVARLVSLFV